MGKQKVWLQSFILIALVLVGGFAIGQSLFAGDKIPREGDKAPGFSLPGSDGQARDLASYEGRVVVVNFWGSFCPPCKEEMPAIQSQYDKWKSRGVEVLAVNLGESEVTAQGFVRQHGLTFPILYDPNLAVRDQYGVNLYPTTFFIDPKGRIQHVKIGEMNETFIEQTLKGMVR